MLVRALKVLDYFLPDLIRTNIATAALDQPGDEGWAYGRGTRERQRFSERTISLFRPGRNVPP
jgi:hypothetical protein